jgi:hypothetical protein
MLQAQGGKDLSESNDARRLRNCLDTGGIGVIASYLTIAVGKQRGGGGMIDTRPGTTTCLAYGAEVAQETMMNADWFPPAAHRDYNHCPSRFAAHRSTYPRITLRQPGLNVDNARHLYVQ